jgi:hypothetical protein
MIITDFNKWDGYQFGNKLLGLNNLLQISNYYEQDYYFTPFKGLDMFDIKNQTKEYNNEAFEIIDNNIFFNQDKNSIILDNNKIYYLTPCLVEFYHKFNSLSTFDIFKFKESNTDDRKLIGVHFRGTDFKIWDDKCILPYEYYKDSIDFIINEIKENFTFILFTDDYELTSFKNIVNYLNLLEINYIFGDINDFRYDFKMLSNCEYIISSPSTFCITASFCGKKNKKIIHSQDFIINYKNKSDYFRDIFWKRLLDFNNNNNDYNLYKLI